MKIDRLLSIIMTLIEHKKISATKLAEMFEVTPRTIYRDIETINAAGIPIVAFPGSHGGISIMEGYKLDRNVFTSSDLVTLLIGLGSISSTLSTKEMVHTITKVKGLIPDEQAKQIELKSNQIVIDLTTWAGNKTIHDNVHKIKDAISGNNYIIFHYTDGNGKKSRRKVEPYQLVLKESQWYMQGYCFLKKEFRIFKLTRMSLLQLKKATFSPRAFTPKAMDGAGWIDKRIIYIKVVIHETIRDRIVERCGEEHIKSIGNNKLMLKIPFTEDEHGYNFLLGLGDKCECLAPARVRQELTRRIQELLKIYKS